MLRASLHLKSKIRQCQTEVFHLNGTSPTVPLPSLEGPVHQTIYWTLPSVPLSFAQSAAPHLSHHRASSIFISSF